MNIFDMAEPGLGSRGCFDGDEEGFPGGGGGIIG